MDEGGVDAAVIHPPGWDPGSTDMAFAAVRDYPGRFAIMGALPLDDPGSRARIARWREQPGMLGLRYGFLAGPPRQLAARRQPGLAMGGSRKGRSAGGCVGDGLARRAWPRRRTPSGAAPDDRPSGRARRPDDAEGRCRDDPHAAASGTGEAAQRRGQGDRRAGLLGRGVSISDDADLSAADLRCVRAAPRCSGAPTSPRCRAPGASA